MSVPQKRLRGRPRLAPSATDAGGVQTLDRAVVLMRAVAEANGLSLTETAAAAGLPASTAYRMLATLQRHGIVAFDETAQLWYIGAECFRIGAAFLRRRKIAEHGREVMQALVAQSGETANLAVAEEDGVVFVSQVETHEPIRAFFRPGTRAPFHASGVGKAILAHLPAARVAALLDRLTLDRFTEHTITDRATLTSDLARTRARGWALDDEERYPGMRCVAAPIFNEFGEPIAGLSLSGPTVRMTPATVAALGPVVRDAAAAITRSIGGIVPAQE